MTTQLSLSPRDYEVIEEIRKATGVLIVRDSVTFPGTPEKPTSIRPYGIKWHPKIKTLRDGTEINNENAQHERVIQRRYFAGPGGITRYPEGIPCGVTLRYARKSPRDVGGDDSFVMHGGEDDACKEELSIVRAYVQHTTWMTQAERSAGERRNEEIRAKRAISDLDPAASTGKSLAEALMAFAKSQQAPAAKVVDEDVPETLPVHDAEAEAAAAERESLVVSGGRKR